MVSPIAYCMASTLARDLAGGFQNIGADLFGIADRFRDRKHRQQPVAHELQDFSAMRPDRRHLTIEH